MITNRKIRGTLVLDLKQTRLTSDEIDDLIDNTIQTLVANIAHLGGGVATTKSAWNVEVSDA